VFHTPHPLWFDQPNTIWRRVQILKLFIIQFTPASFPSSLLRLYILPSTLFTASVDRIKIKIKYFWNHIRPL
jgi:hypothetical protein